MPERPAGGGGRFRPVATFAARVVLVSVVPIALTLGLLAIEDAFALGSDFVIAVLAAVFVLVASVLWVRLRDLRAAEARNREALSRAASAEAAQLRHRLVEVQRSQRQLVQASKLGAVGELAAAVAHEVNNPLTGILGFSELLLTELPEDDPRRGEAQMIRDEAIRARSIIRALLEFARPRPLQRISTSLNDLTRSTLELVRYRASLAAVEIVADYADVARVEIDPDAIESVLLNLFNNAIDAMPAGGNLYVSTISDPDRIGVIVADGGVGMDRETRSRIFAPFFSTRSEGGGTSGLGLSVSLQVVENHGGTIDVESSPGEGSVFTVWLPTAWPAFEAPASSAAPATQPGVPL